MYDSTAENALDALKYWFSEIKEVVNTKYATFVIAAKIDLSEKEKVSIKEAGEFAKMCGAELF